MREVRATSAAVYLRISQDRTGERAGVRRQEEDCFALAKQLGYEDPPVFIDNDISAFDGGRRPGYDSLVSHIRTGVTVVFVWHVDRLYRRPRELENLIDLVEHNPVRIETIQGGGFDLNTHEGRLMARQLVAIAAYESGHKSDRVKRANRRLESAWECRRVLLGGSKLADRLCPIVVASFMFYWWHVSDARVKALSVVPMHPRRGSLLDLTPGHPPDMFVPDHLGLK